MPQRVFRYLWNVPPASHKKYAVALVATGVTIAMTWLLLHVGELVRLEKVGELATLIDAVVGPAAVEVDIARTGPCVLGIGWATMDGKKMHYTPDPGTPRPAVTLVSIEGGISAPYLAYVLPWTFVSHGLWGHHVGEFDVAKAGRYRLVAGDTGVGPAKAVVSLWHAPVLGIMWRIAIVTMPGLAMAVFGADWYLWIWFRRRGLRSGVCA